MQRSVWLVEVETIVSQLLDREGHRLILRLNAVAHVSDNRRGIANRELYTVLGLCERSYRWWFIRSSAAIGNESSTYTITATFTDIEGKVYRSTGPRVK